MPSTTHPTPTPTWLVPVTPTGCNGFLIVTNSTTNGTSTISVTRRLFVRHSVLSSSNPSLEPSHTPIVTTTCSTESTSNSETTLSAQIKHSTTTGLVRSPTSTSTWVLVPTVKDLGLHQVISLTSPSDRTSSTPSLTSPQTKRATLLPTLPPHLSSRRFGRPVITPCLLTLPNTVMPSGSATPPCTQSCNQQARVILGTSWPE